jgi:hypothetical protein
MHRKPYTGQVTLDASGNVFVAGTFHSATMRWDGDSGRAITTAGSGNVNDLWTPDVFVAKVNRAGSLLWLLGAGGNKGTALQRRTRIGCSSTHPLGG